MDHSLLKLVLFFFLICRSSLLVHSQQPYIGKATTDCNNRHESTSGLGYQCNGENRSCQAYLTFRSQPPFNSVSSISNLLGADPSQLSQLNSVSRDAIFETSKTVLVPVSCSCSGPYYQANTTFIVQPQNSFLSIANSIFLGLTTCQALQVQNSNISYDSLVIGTRINVPLRCACPTKNQTDDGVKYLLSYVIAEGQWVEMISSIFGVDTAKTLEANGLSIQDATIYPNTTLLVPLQNPPSGVQVLAPPPPPPPQLPPSTPLAPPSGGSSKKTWIYAVIGTLGGLVLALASGIFLFCLYSHKRKEQTDTMITSQSFETIEKPINQKLDENSEVIVSESISSIAQSLQVYTYTELQLATENFSPNCRIKGSVYRGVIKGDFAAIKKMSGDVSDEINLLKKINHLNLIRLSGVCFNDGYCYLVYEYAPNGPLSDWIYSDQGNSKNILTWTQRIQIALDVATGLNYLHSYTSPPYVHKDLKCSHVLLDGDFRAKISNFSLARSTDGQSGEFALTRHIVGTKGYMAPEYLENGLISPKLDVYAFGVLLLEILTGKEVSVLYESVNMHLADMLIPVLQVEDENEESLSRFIDPSLKGNYPSELVISVIRLINSCLKNDPSSRPSMHEIVQSLSTAMTNTLSWESTVSVSIV